MYSTVKQLNVKQIRVFWTLVMIVVSFVALNIYFATIMTLDTADRSHFEESIRDIKSVISQSEYQLIDKDREITLEYAKTLGFHAVGDSVFVYRDPLRSLSLNEQ